MSPRAKLTAKSAQPEQPAKIKITESFSTGGLAHPDLKDVDLKNPRAFERKLTSFIAGVEKAARGTVDDRLPDIARLACARSVDADLRFGALSALRRHGPKQPDAIVKMLRDAESLETSPGICEQIGGLIIAHQDAD